MSTKPMSNSGRRRSSVYFEQQELGERRVRSAARRARHVKIGNVVAGLRVVPVVPRVGVVAHVWVMRGPMNEDVPASSRREDAGRGHAFPLTQILTAPPHVRFLSCRRCARASVPIDMACGRWTAEADRGCNFGRSLPDCVRPLAVRGRGARGAIGTVWRRMRSSKDLRPT